MGAIVSQHKRDAIYEQCNTDYEKLKEIVAVLNSKKFTFNSYNQSLCRKYVCDAYEILQRRNEYIGLFPITKIEVFYYTVRHDYVENPNVLFDVNLLIGLHLTTGYNGGLYFPWSHVQKMAYKIILYIIINEPLKFSFNARSINVIMFYTICNNDYKNAKKLLETFVGIIDYNFISDNGETFYTYSLRKNAFNIIELLNKPA